MCVPIRLPALRTRDERIRVGVWYVEVGDSVDRGDRILEVGIRGISLAVDSPASGVLRRIEQWTDSVVEEGDVLGWIETTEGEEAG
ncbi:MAG: hypothetical protein CMJ48_03840 [Planctomycetaceae bacterium]|nr:hypothetical protein [Planctomycetaceae bacterium]